MSMLRYSRLCELACADITPPQMNPDHDSKTSDYSGYKHNTRAILRDHVLHCPVFLCSEQYMGKSPPIMLVQGSAT